MMPLKVAIQSSLYLHNSINERMIILKEALIISLDKWQVSSCQLDTTWVSKERD